MKAKTMFKIRSDLNHPLDTTSTISSTAPLPPLAGLKDG